MTFQSSFSNLFVTSPTSQRIFKQFRSLPTSQLILQPFHYFTYVTVHEQISFSYLFVPSPTSPTHSPTLPSLYPRHSSFSNHSVTSTTSQFISRAHSPTFSSLHLRRSSFSNTSVALPTSQLILQHYRRFTYVTAHCQTLPLLHLPHSSWAELILQRFRHFTYVTAHSDSPSFPSLHLHHNSFSNPSVALPTSQLIVKPFRCFTYVTAHSPTLLSLLLRHKLFT